MADACFSETEVVVFQPWIQLCGRNLFCRWTLTLWKQWLNTYETRRSIEPPRQPSWKSMRSYRVCCRWPDLDEICQADAEYLDNSYPHIFTNRCRAMLCKRGLCRHAVSVCHVREFCQHTILVFSTPNGIAIFRLEPPPLTGASNAVGRNRDSEPISGLTAWC